MKKLTVLVLALQLLFLTYIAFSESNEFEQIIFEKEENRIKAWNHAHKIAQEIVDDYGIEIYIQEECDEVGIEAPFSFGHDFVIESTLDKAMGYFDLPDYLSYLQQTLSIYPKDMFEPFKKYGGNLRILLPNGIREEGSRYFPSGVTTSKDGWYNIYVGLAGFDIITVQHELWHAFEYRIKDEFPDAFTLWETLNPEGFQYLNQDYDNDNKPEINPSLLLPETTAWFARNYSVTNAREDRASLYEMLFYEGNFYVEKWWEYPHLYDKIMEMNKELNQAFPNYQMLHKQNLKARSSKP